MTSLQALWIAAVLTFSTAASAQVITRDFSVKGWHCGGCGAKTAAVVKKVDGVKDAVPDVGRGVLRVTYDDQRVNPAQVTAAVEKLGYSCPLR